VENDYNAYGMLTIHTWKMHSLFRLFFTAIFVRKNKIHRKYMHLFRQKNKRLKNKTNVFFGAKNEKENEIWSVSSVNLRRPIVTNRERMVFYSN